MLVDFHVHSTASDGTDSPTEIAAKTASFAIAALTDHDNCDGTGEFLAAAPGPALRVAGAELSIEPGAGFDRFHMLCLGVDPENSAFKTLLAKILEGRNARNARIIENFARMGIAIPVDEIAAYAKGDILARPHFARWLFDHGYAPGLKSAFQTYLAPDSPPETRAYEERWHPTQEEAFAAVHAAGGIAVMAHPKFWCVSWKHGGCDFAKAERELWRLKEAGLDGLEALYQANSPGEDFVFTDIATRIGFLKTAGSDYHGGNKPNIPIGMEVEEAFIAPVVERLKQRV